MRRAAWISSQTTTPAMTRSSSAIPGTSTDRMNATDTRRSIPLYAEVQACLHCLAFFARHRDFLRDDVAEGARSARHWRLATGGLVGQLTTV